MDDLPPLMPVPSQTWQAEFDKLMNDPYLSKKYDRDRRIREQRDYIAAHCPWIFDGPPRSLCGIVDVGPGPGEFMELCRHHGWPASGVDAVTGRAGMGNEYLLLSRLMHGRQNLRVSYCGFLKWTERLDSFLPKSALVNFRGSWEQCWHFLLEGPPHHEHHDSRLQRWPWSHEQFEWWKLAFDRMHKHALDPGGRILIAMNRGADHEQEQKTAEWLKDAARSVGLVLERQWGSLTLLWKKDA